MARATPVDDLPPELLAEVLQRLPLASLACAARTCRAWRAAAADPSVWRALLLRDFDVADDAAAAMLPDTPLDEVPRAAYQILSSGFRARWYRADLFNIDAATDSWVRSSTSASNDAMVYAAPVSAGVHYYEFRATRCVGGNTMIGVREDGFRLIDEPGRYAALCWGSGEYWNRGSYKLCGPGVDARTLCNIGMLIDLSSPATPQLRFTVNGELHPGGFVLPTGVKRWYPYIGVWDSDDSFVIVRQPLFHLSSYPGPRRPPPANWPVYALHCSLLELEDAQNEYTPVPDDAGERADD